MIFFLRRLLPTIIVATSVAGCGGGGGGGGGLTSSPSSQVDNSCNILPLPPNDEFFGIDVCTAAQLASNNFLVMGGTSASFASLVSQPVNATVAVIDQGLNHQNPGIVGSFLEGYDFLPHTSASDYLIVDETAIDAAKTFSEGNVVPSKGTIPFFVCGGVHTDDQAGLNKNCSEQIGNWIHGTAVAGIIAGRSLDVTLTVGTNSGQVIRTPPGIAPGTKIVPIQIFGATSLNICTTVDTGVCQRQRPHFVNDTSSAVRLSVAVSLAWQHRAFAINGSLGPGGQTGLHVTIVSKKAHQLTLTVESADQPTIVLNGKITLEESVLMFAPHALSQVTLREEGAIIGLPQVAQDFITGKTGDRDGTAVVFAVGNNGLHDGDNARFYHRTFIENPFVTLTVSGHELIGSAFGYEGTLATTASFTIANDLSVPLFNNVDIRKYGLDSTLTIEWTDKQGSSRSSVYVTRAATGYYAGMYLLPGQQALKPYWLAVAASRNITVGGVVTPVIAPYSHGCGVLWERCITAPGGVMALFNDLADATKTKHIYGEGTSFAAPYVTGALALLKSRSPSLRADAASEILLRTADDLGPEGPDPIYGMGHLNIVKALSPVGPITSRAQGGGVNLAGSYLRLAGPLVALAQASSNLAVTGYDSYSRAFYLPVAGMITSVSPADKTPAAQRELSQRQKYIQQGGRFAAGYRSGQLNWLSFAAADGLLIRHELCAPECLASDTGWGLMPQHLELESVTRLQQEILPGNLLALEASAASSAGSAAQWRQLALRSAGSPFAGLWLAAEGGLLAESETLLGSEFGGGFALRDGASSRFVHLTGKLQLGAGMHGYGSYALIGSQAQVPGNGVLVGLSALRADALAVGVRKKRLWRFDDSLRFEFSQPLAVRQGDLLLFVGADGADAAPGQIALNLGQQPRPTVWTLSYSAPMSVLGMSGFFGAALEKRSNAGVFGQDALSYSLAINLDM